MLLSVFVKEVIPFLIFFDIHSILTHEKLENKDNNKVVEELQIGK